MKRPAAIEGAGQVVAAPEAKKQRQPALFSDIEITTGKKFFNDFELKDTNEFQVLLAQAATAVGTTKGARGYRSVVVSTVQRGTFICQVKDCGTSGSRTGVICQTSDKQFGSRQQALVVSFVLLALYDAGAEKQQLERIKRDGTVSELCGRACAR